MWYNLAASRSTGEERENAVKYSDQVSDRLTPEDRSEAQRLAREWDAAHPREPEPAALHPGPPVVGSAQDHVQPTVKGGNRMEALGILGFIFSLAALGKIVLLEKKLKESGILEKAAKS